MREHEFVWPCSLLLACPGRIWKPPTVLSLTKNCSAVRVEALIRTEEAEL